MIEDEDYNHAHTHNADLHTQSDPYTDTHHTCEPPPQIIPPLSEEAIIEIVKKGKLNTISLRLPCVCNFRCSHCYNAEQFKKVVHDKNAVTYKEVAHVLDQAFDLGARYVWIVGEGEPFFYKSQTKTFLSLLDHMNQGGARPLIFTNCTLITKDLARALSKKDVFIIGKMNSLNPRVQNEMCGTKFAYSKLKQGIENLIEAGFTDDPTRLSMETIISKRNYTEIPVLWRLFRSKNIIPFVEKCTPPAEKGAFRTFLKDTYVEPQKMRTLFDTLLTIDQTVYGYTWDPVKTYPIAALGCTAVRTSCGITPTGDVQLCAYTKGILGNVKETPLREILLSEEVIHIKTAVYCPDGSLHYGCRSLTVNVTGDRFAVDPFWREFEGECL